MIVINYSGFVVSGEGLGDGAYLFDYADTEYDLDNLKSALKKSDNCGYHTAEIGFRYQGKRTEYICTIFLKGFYYLIGLWEISNNVIYFPA